MIFSILLLVPMILHINGAYQSTIQLSPMGLEYQPNNNIRLISTNMAETVTRCSLTCNQLLTCRIFDYDTLSKRCRLFDGDTTTGSITSSSSPTSLVGTVYISPALYSSIYNQPCQSCQQNRYQVCSTNTTTCQCPDHSYWNGSVCALQLLQDESCFQSYMCRSDLNLTCASYCYGYLPVCSQSAMFIYNATNSFSLAFGTTIAGACNNSGNINETVLIDVAGIALDVNNNTLYVGDDSNRLLAFTLNNRVARVVGTYGSWPTFMHVDNRTSSIYITVLSLSIVYILPSNKTIPPNGVQGNNCSLLWLNQPTGIILDSSGNVYISSLGCNWITKWAPNATISTLFAGSPTGNYGWDSLTLYAPYGMVLDEPNSFLYVADHYNYRIQRFPLNGSGIGVTVAGDNGEAAGANQFYRPTDLYLSKVDGSLYVVDCYNHRIQKWLKNAISGITIAGSPNGTSGNTPYLLNRPYDFAFDAEEKYMYVSDGLNNRIQRFTL